jgi:hypothetical protein
LLDEIDDGRAVWSTVSQIALEDESAIIRVVSVFAVSPMPHQRP